ncbi:MAG TPA: hypothetical protein VET27_08105 [Mycobacterium sp.]|nr:hypothetical protein [Mycobacterium sp.]
MSTRHEPASSNLADAVLPLIRTRAELYRRGAANGHGQQMHEALDILESEIPTADAGEVYTVAHKALASAIKVIAHADDSDGIIGDACRRLLDLHPKVAAAAKVPSAKLVDWMVKFQFVGEVDYFTLDPVTYAAALGEAGMTAYRSRLTTIAEGLGPRPSSDERWESHHSHDWFTLDWNARRLAVHDHDIDAIIRTHARDRRVAAWLQDTAKAFEEISEFDLAIDWAKQATDFDRGHQSRRAADYWCELLDQHRPQESLEARLIVFRRWPSSTTAARLHAAASTSWPDYHDEVFAALSASPSDAVLFVLLTLDDVEFAWSLAHSLTLDSDSTWSRLIGAYEKVDPLAVIPIHRRLLEKELVVAGAKHYRSAGRRLMRMRKLTAGSEVAGEVEALIADLREVHRRRPRLQKEFDRAGLP